MTKMKSKKMTKSTFAIIIMAIVMVAMLAFGGTYAYFTANAIGEEVTNIRTAKLELLNKNERLTYDGNAQIVPGDYVFGDGTIDGKVDWSGKITTHDYKTIDLDLGNTTAAVYAFVRVTVKAYATLESGETIETAPALMVGTTGGFVPVLKLIPRLGKDRVFAEGYTPVNAGWQEFTNTEVTDVDYSTYIFYYKVDDETSLEEGQDANDKYRKEFNDDDFDFSLQFDSRVHADRIQYDTTGSVPEGYIAIDSVRGIAEKTNVYKESDEEKTTPVQIMDVGIYFEMEFATIQQTGLNTPADAYRAAFADFGKGDYTDNDMNPATPGNGTPEPVIPDPAA